MGFLSPWFLGGLAAIGLPIYVHLLRQYKQTPQPFASLMFFERRTQSSVKHRRLMYLLLFALRCAFVFLLALAFARPYLSSSAAPSAVSGKAVLIAVDNSFSMRQGDRFDAATAKQRGLVNAVVPAAQLEAETAKVVKRLLSLPPLALARTKALLPGVW